MPTGEAGGVTVPPGPAAGEASVPSTSEAVGAQPNLTAAAVTGGAWRAFSVFGGALLQFVVSIILARLLVPSDFGTVALVGIVVGVVNAVAFLGIEPALVQRRTLDRDHLTSAWTLSAVGGVVASIAVAAAAPLLARLVGDPASANVFVVVSPTLLFVGLRTCSSALLRRDMNFRKLMVVDVVSYALGYALVAIPMALLGWGVWALVAALVCQGLVAWVLAYGVVRHPLRLGLPRRATRDVLGFGGGMAASSLASYAALNGDYFVVGRMLGTGPLGLYARAYSLMTLPLTYLASVLSQVLLPAYSRAQDDRARMTRGYLASIYLVFTLSAPMMMFMLVAAPYLVDVLYGSGWEGAVAPLQVFAVFGAFRATYHLGGAVAQASGRPWSEFVRQVLYASLVIGGAVVGSHWGIVGVAWTTGGAILVMYAAMARLAHNVLAFAWRSFATAHMTGALAAVVVLAASLGGRRLAASMSWPYGLTLAVLAVMDVVVALTTVGLLPHAWRPDAAERAVGEALRRLPGWLGMVLSRALRVSVRVGEGGQGPRAVTVEEESEQ